MIVITNTIKLKKGAGGDLAARFSRPGDVEKSPGFLALNLLQTRDTEEYDEFVVWTMWASKEAHDEWTKGEAFRKSHSGPRPDYILDSKITYYDVVGRREPAVKEEV